MGKVIASGSSGCIANWMRPSCQCALFRLGMWAGLRLLRVAVCVPRCTCLDFLPLSNVLVVWSIPLLSDPAVRLFVSMPMSAFCFAPLGTSAYPRYGISVGCFVVRGFGLAV